MANKDSTVTIGNVNLGGLSDSIFSGPANSVASLVGYDLHSTPGILKVRQKLAKVSGTTVDEYCKAKVVVPNGDVYWFSSTSGKVWKWAKSNGAWTLVYTTVPAAGNAGCSGARYYQGYIYWATQSRLHRIAYTGVADWTANAALNWQTLTNSDDSYHPMKEVNQVLYIGDANQIHQVDAGTFSANALDIKAPLRVKCLGRIGTDLAIGTYVSDYVTQCEVLRWNTWSVSYTFSDPIDESGINAFLESDDTNMLLVQAGKHGHIYYYNGQTLELYRSIPGDFNNANYGSVNPEAVANYPKMILFGFSKELGNPCKQGVYCMGRHNRNYPFVLDFSYPISQRSEANEFVVSDVEVGAIAVSGQDILVSWKNGLNVGVDKVDWSTKLEYAVIESRVAKYPSDFLQTFSKILASYYQLPADTSIDIAYKLNYADNWTDTTPVHDSMRKIFSVEDSPEGNTIQVRATLHSHNNDAPQLDTLQIIPN